METGTFLPVKIARCPVAASAASLQLASQNTGRKESVTVSWNGLGKMVRWGDIFMNPWAIRQFSSLKVI